MVHIIEKPRVRARTMRYIPWVTFVTYGLLLTTILILPNWYWGFGSPILYIQYTLSAFFLILILALRTFAWAYEKGGLRVGTFIAPLHLPVLLPLFLVILDWIMKGRSLSVALGYGTVWHEGIVPVALLALWFFCIRSFFDPHPVRDYISSKRLSTAWSLTFFSFCALIIGHILQRDTNIDTFSWGFVLITLYALGLSFLKVPYTSQSRILETGGLQVGLSVAFLVLLGYGFFLNTTMVQAQYAYWHMRYEDAARKSPYNPEYVLSWAEHELSILSDQYVSDNPQQSKEKISLALAAIRRVEGIDGVGLRTRVARSYVRAGTIVEGVELKALPLYEKVARDRSASLESRVEAARYFRVYGKKSDLSLNIVSNILVANPGYAPAILEKSFALEDQGKSDEALTLLREKKLTDLQVYYHYGRLAYNKGNILEAKEAFLYVTKADPMYADAHYSLGVYYYRAGDLPNALDQFEIVSKLNPHNMDIQKKITDIQARLR